MWAEQWACVRVVIALVGITTIILYAVAGCLVDPGATQTRLELSRLNGTTTIFHGEYAVKVLRADDTQGGIFAGIVYTLISLSFTAANRRRIHELISRKSSQGTARVPSGPSVAAASNACFDSPS